MLVFEDSDSLRAAERKMLGIESQEEYEEYQRRSDTFYALIDDLEDDWEYAFQELALVDDEQFYRRTLTRTLFAVIEGTVFALKHLILEEHRVGLLDLSPAEYAVLAEESYSLDQKGHIKESIRYPGLRENVKFTFSMYARARSASSGFTKPLAKDPRWSNFYEAIKVRNRLTHPKSAEDLIVSDSDWEAVQASEEWFTEQHEHLRAIDDEVFRGLLSQLAEQLSDSTEETSARTAPNE